MGTGPGERRVRFEAELAFLSTAEGGRKTPVLSGYRPDAWFGATDVGKPVLHGIWVDFHDDEIRPGETKSAAVTVRVPEGLRDFGTSLEEGSKFEVREGAQVVARGRVTRMLAQEETPA